MVDARPGYPDNRAPDRGKVERDVSPIPSRLSTMSDRQILVIGSQCEAIRHVARHPGDRRSRDGRGSHEGWDDGNGYSLDPSRAEPGVRMGGGCEAKSSPGSRITGGPP